MPLLTKTVRTITSNGIVATGGAAEVTVQLMLDGAAAANTVAVAANTEVIITDWVVTAQAAGNFRLQQTNDGAAFFDLVILRQPADGTGGVTELRTPIRIVGGATAAFRVRGETPGGSANVSTTVRSYLETNG